MAAITIIFPVFFMLALGYVSRKKGWITPEQKAGANSVIFTVLFPVLIFNLMFTATLEASSVLQVAYVFIAFFIIMLVGKFFCPKKYKHFANFLLTTCEGGGVALPLYLSIVGTSSTTVIFDVAGVLFCFIVIPIFMQKSLSEGLTFKGFLKNLFTNSFFLAVVFGVVLNVIGLNKWIQSSIFADLYNGTMSTALAPITAVILFVMGYDLKVTKASIGPVLQLVAVRVVAYALVIAGFWLFFPALIADKVFMIGVLIYFMCPPGFGTAAILSPLHKDDDDRAFSSAFVSFMIVWTLIVYTAVVVFIA